MTLKDDMVALTTKTKKTKANKKQREAEIAANKARREGRKDGKAMVEEMPARIEKAAKRGETHIYEWCHCGSDYGHAKLGYVAKWAKEQGFKTKWSYNNEPANEGGYGSDDLEISWK